MISSLFIILFFSLLPIINGETGITLNACEIGIAKFHRLNNLYHPYGNNSAWKVFVLGENSHTPQLVKNSEESYTIFFSTLEELIISAIQLISKINKNIDVFNINAHGMPGAMDFPKDQEELDLYQCQSGQSDQIEYSKYYQLFSKKEMEQFQRISMVGSPIEFPCATGIVSWTRMVRNYPQIKQIFNPGAQIHFLSCLVGLGITGEMFATELAKLLFSRYSGKIQTPLNYGLGDWSTNEGMSFWDYINETQYEQDFAQYSTIREDRKFMQKGNIRVVEMSKSGEIQLGIIPNVDFMFLTYDMRRVIPTKSDVYLVPNIYTKSNGVILRIDKNILLSLILILLVNSYVMQL